MANTATGSTAEMRLANRNTYTDNSKSVKNFITKNYTNENETYTPCAYELEIMSELIFEGHETRKYGKKPSHCFAVFGIPQTALLSLLSNGRKASTFFFFFLFTALRPTKYFYIITKEIASSQ
jgi:hypothetical protein